MSTDTDISEKEHLQKIEYLEEEVDYLKEQLKAQRIMLKDAIEYIKELEDKVSLLKGRSNG